jgi:predicted tellurium resistance membrane protein TerC
MPQTISVMLIYVGIKMSVAWRGYHTPVPISLAVIVGFLTVGVVASLVSNRRRAPDASRSSG